MDLRNCTRSPYYNGARLSGFSEELVKIAAVRVGPYQQKTQYTCAAATLKAVLSYLGFDIPEEVLTILVRIKKRNGAETTQIVDAAKKLGFRTFERSFTIEEAKRITDKGIPIICDIQSFTKPGAGHYVVLAGIEGGSVYLMDPNVEGNKRIIPLEEFSERWWDREMRPPHKLMIRWGIVVLPPRGI